MLRIGAGVSVTDFKADLVVDMLNGMIPRAKEPHTPVIDLADTAWPVAINPLHQPRAADRSVIADSLLTLIGRFGADKIVIGATGPCKRRSRFVQGCFILRLVLTGFRASRRGGSRSVAWRLRHSCSPAGGRRR